MKFALKTSGQRKTKLHNQKKHDDQYSWQQKGREFDQKLAKIDKAIKHICPGCQKSTS